MSDAAAKRRARQTVVNLILALAACLGIVLIMILGVPRDDSMRITKVDYKSVAAEVKNSTGLEVAAPAIDQGWWSNAARWQDKPADGVRNWHVGFVSPKNKYVSVDEAFGANPTWLAQRTKDYLLVETITTYGNWTLQKFEGQTESKKGQQLSAWTEENGHLVILSGTASLEEFKKFAKALELPGF